MKRLEKLIRKRSGGKITLVLFIYTRQRFPGENKPNQETITRMKSTKQKGGSKRQSIKKKKGLFGERGRDL